MLQLPDSFISLSKEIFKEEYSDFLNALESKSPTSIRINDKIDLIPSNEQVNWCKTGFYLNERPLFTADPLFHGGAYYVQEASSMFLHQVVKQHFSEAKTVLDLCAAPGGKSTLLAQTLGEDCLLICNEIIHSRAQILTENIIKWGNLNTIVTNNKPIDFKKFTNYFDAIVIDAPCSGEGMFRKDNKAIDEWSLHNIYKCVERQKNILTDIWDSLKTNGILVYSTCTYNYYENENNIAWICENLGAENLSVECNDNNITITEYGYRFYPHKTKGEGFFISVLRKTSKNNISTHKHKSNKQFKSISNTDFSTYLKNNLDLKIIEQDNLIKAFPSDRINDFQFIESQLNCLYNGLLIGETKGRDFIPSIQLALSKQIERNNIASYEIDKTNALKYLKKEQINLSIQEKKYVLICYKGLSLGWVKNLGNRNNNLFPNNWKIRMNIPIE
jgi:NOL1/NOP2/sun family putative RNA methylase